jgi:hypothetical protein
VSVRVIVVEHVGDGKNRLLALLGQGDASVPLGDLGEVLLLEVSVELSLGALVVGEDEEEVLELGLVEEADKVTNRLALEVGAEELSDKAERDALLDNVLLGKGGEELGGDLHLDDEARNSLCEVGALSLVKLVEVADEQGEERVLKGALEVAVTLGDAVDHVHHTLDGVPVAERLILVLKKVDGRAHVVEVLAAGLEETTEEEDLKQLARVLEQLERRARLDELGYKRIGCRGSRDEREVEEELLAEDYVVVSNRRLLSTYLQVRSLQSPLPGPCAV